MKKFPTYDLDSMYKSDWQIGENLYFQLLDDQGYN